MKIYFICTSDGNVPSGGMRQIYRHIDVLNEIGYEATVVHVNRGFRVNWFDNNTKICSHDDLVLDKDDVVVLSEFSEHYPKFEGIEKCKKIIYAQGTHLAYQGFGGNLNDIKRIYDNEVDAIICVSKYAKDKFEFFFPDMPVHRIRYSFDRPPFFHSFEKQKQICYMPRKRKDDIDKIFNLLHMRNYLDEWDLIPIENMSEEQVADVMRQSAIFMSFGYREGFHMPPAEAMVCGCVAIGYHGYSCQDIFRKEFAYPIEDGDVLTYAKTLKELTDQGLDEIVKKGKLASDFVTKNYSEKNEIRQIGETYETILRGKKTICQIIHHHPQKSEVFPLEGVAAFISTFDEGPFLKGILKWLSVRVEKIFVIESATTFYSNMSLRERQTETIVNEVLREIPDAPIVYHVMEGDEHPNPAVKETSERNKAIDLIKSEGYEWIWIIDADEMYSNEEAEDLWKWFYHRLDENPSLRGVRCSLYTYWRSLHWRIDPPEPLKPNIIIKSDSRIAMSRHLIDESSIIDIPSDICSMRHYSWAREPSYIERKINTWTHAHQLLPQWYKGKFLKWTPGSNIKDLHPTVPACYKETIECNFEVPEVLQGHPWHGVEMIEDEHEDLKILPIILNHNKPENADSLYEQLSQVFDKVELFDSGSDFDKVPINVTSSFPNIYWTGAWNDAMDRFSDYDVIWIIGCDIQLLNEVNEYKRSIVDSYPFGCWSPSIKGRAHPFMLTQNYEGKAYEVNNIEGMAFAISGKLAKEVGQLLSGSEIGFGQDYWLCYKSRQAGMRNVIDGSVALFHPDDIGYDEQLAHGQMEKAFAKTYGPNFRQDIFNYSPSFDGNKIRLLDHGENNLVSIVKSVKEVTIITPTYHRSVDTVKRCIDCVRAQTLCDWEHVICSDGEFEGAISALVDAQDDVRLSYQNTPDREDGDYGNRVRASVLQQAAGRYVVFFDDDNIILPTFLEKMIGAIRREEADFAICQCMHFGPLQPFLGKPPVVLTGIPPRLYYIDTLQVVAKTQVMQDIGWQKEHGYFTDGNVYQEMAEKYKYVEVPEVLALHL